VVCAGAIAVLSEIHIQHPVESILNAPMSPNGSG
jgi:hypothetical protein